MPAAARADRQPRGLPAVSPGTGPGAGARRGAVGLLAVAYRAGPPVDAVVERLDAERVPGAEELPGPGVPDGERVHAAQPVHDVLADPGVGLQQHLGVPA